MTTAGGMSRIAFSEPMGLVSLLFTKFYSEFRLKFFCIMLCSKKYLLNKQLCQIFSFISIFVDFH